MQDEINELKQVCQELLKTIVTFPEIKREEVLFDKWSLKDSVAHLSGWNLQRISELENFLNGKPIEKIDNFDTFNAVVVGKRKEDSWDVVFNEFVKSCDALVEAFEKVPEDMMEKKIWPDSITTPLKWLVVDTEHMRDEHLAQLYDLKK